MRRATAVLGPILAAVAVAAAAWQTRTLEPSVVAGLDVSWRVALHLTALRHVGYGPGFVWTYGPLGFLAFPLAVSSGTLLASFAVSALVAILVAYLLIRRVRAAFGLVLAIVLSYLVLGLPLGPGDGLLVIVLLLAIDALEEPDGRLGRAFPFTGAVVAAITSLTKTNDGGAAILIVGAVCVALWATGRRRAVWAPAVFAVAFLAGWLLAGDSLSAIPEWTRLSLSLVAGYSGAMQYELGLEHQFLLAAAVAALLVLVAARRARAIGRARGAALLVVAAVYAFAAFKEGFVRHDLAHNSGFFAALAIAGLAFAARDDSRVAALLAVFVSIFALHHSSQLRYAPIANARRAATQLADVAVAHRRSALVSESAASARRDYAVPASVLAALRGHTVHVDPFDTAAIWAYGLAWRPLPLPQAYSVYTSELDEHQVSYLGSSHAPQRILRLYTTTLVNDRPRELEAPGQFRALICDDVQTTASGDWQVLAHVPDRCGPERPLGTRTVASGDVVAVPEAGPNELVVAHVHLHQPFWNSLLGLVYKPRTPSISLDGGAYVQLVAATAADGIVLHVPGSAGFGPKFGGALDWTTVAVGTVGGGPVTIEFDAVPVRGATPAPVGERTELPLPHDVLEHAGGADRIAAPDGRVLPVAQNGGFVDYAYVRRDSLVLQGWAGASGRPATTILVFADGKLVFAGPPNTSRPDVATQLRKPALAHAGYQLILPLSEVRTKTGRRSIRVFAVVGGRAYETYYTPPYGWG